MRFAVMVYHPLGVLFLDRLRSSGLTPAFAIVNDPFFTPGGGPRGRVRRVRRQLRSWWSRSHRRRAYQPYFCARQHGLPTWPMALANHPALAARMTQLQLDYLFVFTGILLQPHIFDAPTHGTINFHSAYLPRHRGGTPTFWSLQQGEKEAGITLHYIDAGIDTGPIIERYIVPLSGLEDSNILNNYLCALGARKMVELLLKLQHGWQPETLQPQEPGSYENRVRARHRVVSTANDARTILNTVAAAAAYNRATFTYQGQTYRLLDAFVHPDQTPDSERLPRWADGQLLIQSADAVRLCLVVAR